MENKLVGGHEDGTDEGLPCPVGTGIANCESMKNWRITVWQPEHKTTKIGILSGIIGITLGIHYGWLVEPIFGHVHWVHAIHGRFCYIPIVIAAAWFGTRGSFLVAAIISILVMPYILSSDLDVHSLADEFTEIVFYFAIALLSGLLIDRELRARKRAQDARLQLERSQKLSLVGQIAAGMAHEIKNPLASIKGAVEILGDDSTSPADKEEFREIVFKEIRRVNRSVTDFLEFARPSETKFESVDLSDIVRESVKQLEVQARSHGITIVENLADDVGVNADREKIHQVLLNLILNAVQASSDGKSVSITLSKNESSGQALLTVEDNGSGIDDNNLDRLFEPFFSTKSTGTGLGLAIAKSIIEKHGGSISLQNRTEEGVTATVTLPLKERK
ncbi:MAG: ATP-binding protein [Planctomycetota bacterium]|jgi:signal transduction histidine kinase